MKYHILMAETAGQLSREVNAWLKMKWNPQGGVGCVTGNEGRLLGYVQAMVKEDDSA